jgi:hypothetical protein
MNALCVYVYRGRVVTRQEEREEEKKGIKYTRAQFASSHRARGGDCDVHHLARTTKQSQKQNISLCTHKARRKENYLKNKFVFLGTFPGGTTADFASTATFFPWCISFIILYYSLALSIFYMLQILSPPCPQCLAILDDLVAGQ